MAKFYYLFYLKYHYNNNRVPYYYKYGFKYSQEKDHINAKKNNKKLKKYLTSILDINKLTSLITIKLNKIELFKETIDKDIQNIMIFIINIKIIILKNFYII
jgi:hypothetical protein